MDKDESLICYVDDTFAFQIDFIERFEKFNVRKKDYIRNEVVYENLFKSMDDIIDYVRGESDD